MPPITRDEEGKVLQQLRAWGSKVIHVFDRGYASGFWIGLLLDFELRFVLRFKGKNHLLDAAGNRRACWRIPFGKRGWEERVVWDSRRASDLCMPVCWPCPSLTRSLPISPSGWWSVAAKGASRGIS